MICEWCVKNKQTLIRQNVPNLAMHQLQNGVDVMVKIVTDD